MKSDKQTSLKPVDIVVALQLILSPEPKFADLAVSVEISHGEAHNSLRRLGISRLTRPERRAVSVERLLAFITAGVPVAFPVIYGPEARGVPTAHSAPPFSPYIAVDAEPLVWADAEGTGRGTALVPLYPRAPALARTNPPLYELLTLVDSVRIGRSRETTIAIDLLVERLRSAAGGA